MKLRLGLAALFSVALSSYAGAVQLDQIKLPDGFSISVWAEVPGARSMAIGDDFVIVGTMGDKLYAVPLDPGSMAAGEVKMLADGLNSANGVTLVDGMLYLAEQHQVTRWGDTPFDINAPVPTPVKIGPDLLDNPWHGWRYMDVGPDGRLYIAIGTPCNVCMPSEKDMAGSIFSMETDGSDVQVVASGIRNSVGLAFHPVNGDLYFTDNGADMMGDNTPPEELNRLTETGQNFGYPWFGGGRARTAEFRDQSVPEGVQFPIEEFQAHTAGLGFAFYQGSMFPSGYQGDVLLAQHGSWNRTFPVGYRVMRVRIDENGNATGKEVFASGWLKRGRDWGRPVDVKGLPDGSILVSDDKAGVIYRIAYGE
ncbi:MAG: PQQ-dependent sugar dehydrogenase [Alphaproteobacteria bacterium]